MRLELIQSIKRTAAAVAVLCGVYVAGFIVGKMDRPKPQKADPPAAAVKHANGSQTLERTNAKPPPPLPEPPGVKARIRTATVDLAPSEVPTSLQMDLVEMKDGTERITVKGPGVIGGMDFALPRPPSPVHKWTLGAGVGLKNYSVMGLRSFGRVEVGALIQRDKADSRAWDAQVIAIWRF